MVAKSNTHCCVPLCTQRVRKRKRNWYMLFVEMLANFFASLRHPEFVPYILSQQTFRRVLVDVFLSIQVLLFRFLHGKKTSPRIPPPPTIWQYQQPQQKSQSIEFACLSLDPEISICWKPEVAIEVPEMGRKFQNEVTNSGITEPNLCAINEMTSLKKVSIILLTFLGYLRTNVQRSKRKFWIWKIKI